ncbi:MAG: cyclomaltodextrinase / maltogenic alpha-amylase / neopullulanase [Chloroflexota bacterium]|jgi:neopullulanase|nr:cyclomaltodextrinase / maltogenic alpha-amylase / neopullulanase [Chloroflexota bacterium]
MTEYQGGPVVIQTPAWVRDAVFYQIFPDRFASSARVLKPGRMEDWDAPPTQHGYKGGDLLGIAERLPELVDLGVNALYLTPIFSSASNHRYHAYDYLAVDPLLGGNPALRELLDRAHELGMRVVLDGVFNHCGRGFWPFHHVLENGADSPYRDWFVLDPDVLAGKRQLNAYPDRHAGGRDLPLGYASWWGHPGLPKLNVSHPPVREYLLSVAEHWLRFGIDGWRLDVPTEIDDTTFWPEFRRRCRAVNPDAYLVGEIWDEAPEWLTGERFDALMNYPLGAAILGFVGRESLNRSVIEAHDIYSRTMFPLDGGAFAARLRHLMALHPPQVTAVQLNLLGSHDAPRALTVLGGDRQAFRLATLLQLVLPGAPCIYYGDEVGMEGGLDPDCRRAYPSDPAKIDGELRAFVAAALAMRHAHPALRAVDVRICASDTAAVALLRSAESEEALVCVNAGREANALDVDLPFAAHRLVELPLPGMPGAELSEAGGRPGAVRVSLAPQSAAVFVRAKTNGAATVSER